MKKIRIVALVMAVVMMLSLISCGKEGTTPTADNSSKTGTNDSVMGRNELNNAYADKEYGFQTELPDEGEEVAVFHTNMGDIYIRLFPEGAPKAVENFKTHIKNGYYDGLIFHRVINDFMIQGGDPKGNGTGGESIWGEAFEDEFCEKLINIRGSLAMANSGVDTNGSQFFIVHASTAPESMIEQMSELSESYPTDCVAAYKQVGGTPWLDYHHTVFGQVYDGMDIVNNIASVAVDGRDKPLDEVKIIEIEVSVL